jgi:hypothetical protein
MKYEVIGVLGVPALVSLLLGLAIQRFEGWQRATGAVLLSAAGVTVMTGISLICIRLSPEHQQVAPDNKLDLFSDYVQGGSLTAAVMLLGLLLIRAGGRRPHMSSG